MIKHELADDKKYSNFTDRQLFFINIIFTHSSQVRLGNTIVYCYNKRLAATAALMLILILNKSYSTPKVILSHMIIHDSKNTCFYRKHFISVTRCDGMLEDLSKNEHPTRLYGWGYTGETLTVREEGTHFGFVVDGLTQVTTCHAGFDQIFTLAKGMYFCVPGSVSVSGGCGIAISSLNYRGMFMIGGPIEEKGRLLYMDGCSDALLVPPTIKGDPCLNHLHFPPGISQTRHTHPSIRIGVVTSGKGRCIVPENEDGTGSDIEIPLTLGQIFVIPAGGQHSFFTDDSTLDIIAYHPDSDTGPTHDDHPMINRTFVNGKSAKNIQEIRTKSIS